MVSPVCPLVPQNGCSNCLFWNNNWKDCIIRAVKKINLEENERLIRQRQLMNHLNSLQTLEEEFDLRSN